MDEETNEERLYCRQYKWVAPFLAFLLALGMVVLGVVLDITFLIIFFVFMGMLAGFTVGWYWYQDIKVLLGFSPPRQSGPPSDGTEYVGHLQDISVSGTNMASEFDRPPKYSDITGIDTKPEKSGIGIPTCSEESSEKKYPPPYNDPGASCSQPSAPFEGPSNSWNVEPKVSVPEKNHNSSSSKGETSKEQPHYSSSTGDTSKKQPHYSSSTGDTSKKQHQYSSSKGETSKKQPHYFSESNPTHPTAPIEDQFAAWKAESNTANSDKSGSLPMEEILTEKPIMSDCDMKSKKPPKPSAPLEDQSKSLQEEYKLERVKSDYDISLPIKKPLHEKPVLSYDNLESSHIHPSAPLEDHNSSHDSDLRRISSSVSIETEYPPEEYAHVGRFAYHPIHLIESHTEEHNDKAAVFTIGLGDKTDNPHAE